MPHATFNLRTERLFILSVVVQACERRQQWCEVPGKKYVTGGSKLSTVMTFAAYHSALDRWVCLYCVMTHGVKVETGTPMEVSFMLCVTNSMWFLQFTITWNWTPECATVIHSTFCIFANFMCILFLFCCIKMVNQSRDRPGVAQSFPGS
jgi:hypothetical protein